MKRIVFAAIGVLVSAAGNPAADIAGPWVTAERDSIVRFDPCGPGWCGRIAKVLHRQPDAPATDVHNPDPALRAHPIEGLQLFTLDRFDGTAWRGKVYDPRSGRVYKALVRRTGNGQLDITGCFGPFCQTRTWSQP
jgi:uncharacterized protein (DUF2147 family)